MRTLLHRGSVRTYHDSTPFFAFWLSRGRKRCIVGAPAVPQFLRSQLDVSLFCAVLRLPRSDGRGGSLYRHRSNTLSPFSRSHLFGTSVVEISPVTVVSAHNQGLMGSRTSSSLQPTETCRSPSSPSVHTPSCIRRPGKCWCICVHFSPFFLTSSCRLSQVRREDLSLIGSQFWFFGLAVFAVSICATFLPLAIVECFLQLVFESIPHMYV